VTPLGSDDAVGSDAVDRRCQNENAAPHSGECAATAVAAFHGLIRFEQHGEAVMGQG
jgi:hypothetical protein